VGSVVKPNLMTSGTAIDMDFDGYDDRLYVADLVGRVWRVNLSANPWTVTQLYSGTQPIQGAPVLSMDSQGRVLVFFGTGKFLVDADRTTTTSQSLYGLIDDGTSTLLTRSSLVDQTSTVNTIPANKRGWYIDLTRSGQRAIRTPALVAGVLFYPTFVPSTGECALGGESWLFKVDFEDGSAPDNQDGTENNTTSGREQSMGQGILSSPSVDLVNEDLILQTSDATVITQDININLQRLVVRSWRQVWNREVTQ
jgi:type IV pilus assembly protein PilY1